MMKLQIVKAFIVVILVSIVICLFGVAVPNMVAHSRSNRCIANLSNIGKSLFLYKQDYGRHKKFPEVDGSKFICAIYTEKILLEESIFLCPSTNDSTTSSKLQQTGNHKTSSSDLSMGNLKSGATSYAGRKNKNQRSYPGLYTLKSSATPLTPMGSDDWQGPSGEGNHEGGRLVHFLFVTAHVESVTIPFVKQGGDQGYSLFQTVSYPDQENPNLGNPLTN